MKRKAAVLIPVEIGGHRIRGLYCNPPMTERERCDLAAFDEWLTGELQEADAVGEVVPVLPKALKAAAGSRGDVASGH